MRNIVGGFGSQQPVPLTTADGKPTTGPAKAMAGASPGDDQLGNYLHALNPYQAVYPPPGTWNSANPPALVDAMAESAKHDYLYSFDSSGIEHDEKPGEWRFKYTDHFVRRALRIPYRYYRPSETLPGTGVLVRDYLMVGFEGGMGY